jgi:hypothetical protein
MSYVLDFELSGQANKQKLNNKVYAGMEVLDYVLIAKRWFSDDNSDITTPKTINISR